MNSEIAEYNCSQSALYATCRIMWTNYVDEQAALAGLRPLYTLAYGTAALAEVTAAQILPDDQARGSGAEVALLDLRNVYAPDGRLKWQMLKAYIEFAFPAHVKPKLEEAGWRHYDEAVRNNWEEMSQLMAKGSAFLADAGNVAGLTADDNMPPGFVAVFEAAKAGFDAQYLLFMNRSLGQPGGTVDKIAANNAIFRKAMRLSKDAPLALANLPERYNKLVFARVLAAVDSGAGDTGYDVTHPVDAGSNKVVQDIVLVEGMIFKIDVLTEGGSVTVCRNVATGCEVSGIAVAFGAPVEILLGDLVGMDNQLVMTNISATPVQVRVRWRMGS